MQGGGSSGSGTGNSSSSSSISGSGSGGSGSGGSGSGGSSSCDKMPLGISLAGLKAFIDSREGGRDAFFGLATEAVKEMHVKLASVKKSYAQMQLEQGSAHVQQANKFVSHTYEYYFLDLVDAVEAWERERPEGSGPFFYYIDVLCVNQHSAHKVVPFEELRGEFAGSIRSIGHTLLLLKWGNPVPLTRAWCVFEINTTLSSGSLLEVIMPPSDTDDFMSALVNNFDSIALQTCSVKVEESKATISLDQENIHRIIRESPGGFLKANQLVIKAMKDWMLARGMAKLQRMGSGERGIKPLILSLGGLLRETGKVAEAEVLHREALVAREKSFKVQLESTLHARYGLFKALMDRVPPGAPMPRGCEAEALLLAVLTDACRLLGESHATTLAVRTDLGMLMIKQNRHQEASELLERHLGVVQGQLGRQHVLALECSTHLAICRSCQGRMGEAEELFTAAYTGFLSSPLHGTDHPRTLSMASNLALLRRKTGQLTGADEIYQVMLDPMRRVLGEEHKNTRKMINDIAALQVAMLHAEKSRGGGAAAQSGGGLEAALARIHHSHPLQRIKEHQGQQRHFRYCDVCNENNLDVVLHTCPDCQKDWCQSCCELGLEHKVLQVST
jgi:hypothetical protein